MINFFDIKKYVLHYENLEPYMRLVLKLKKIRRMLEFNQSQWLKSYIEFDFKKNFKKNRS